MEATAQRRHAAQGGRADGPTLHGGFDVRAELVGVLVATIAVLDQSVDDDRVDRVRHRGVVGAGWLRGLPDVLVGHRHRRVGDKRGPAGDELVQQAPG
jgi:hypothetical protein